MATYDPTRVRLFWGIVRIDGFADGTMIQVSPQGDGVRAVTGTAGETAFIETPNRQHEVTFRLFETANETLMLSGGSMNAALALLFEAGNIPAPLSIASASTGVLFQASSAKLERIPGTTYDNNVPVREWKFIIPRGAYLMSPVMPQP